MGSCSSKRKPLQDSDVRHDYRLGKTLGMGAFGFVFLYFNDLFSQVRECIDRQTRHLRAVKVMQKGATKSSLKSKWHPLNMFKREMGFLRDLDHVNVVKIYGLYEDKDCLYGVMEKMDGGELFPHITQLPTFTESDAANICKQMLEAVNYIHAQGIVHRDIKGENFLFTDKTKNATLKMIDFGIADRYDQGDLTEQCGTLHYLAPEMLRRDYGKEVDVWAVGVIMYLMLYGKFPFRGDDKDSILKEIENYKIDWARQEVHHSPVTIDFLSRLLEKDPKQRFTAAQALKHKFITSLKDGRRQDKPIPRDILMDAVKKEGEAVQKGRNAGTNAAPAEM